MNSMSKDDYYAYIKTMSDPQTPDQWVAALTNPYSLPYKKLMNELLEYRIGKSILLDFMEHWAIFTAQQTQQVREQLIKDYLAATKISEIRMKKSMLDNTPKPLLDVKQMEKEKLKETISNLRVEISKLRSEFSTATSKYDLAKADVKKTADAFSSRQTTKAKDYIADLKKANPDYSIEKLDRIKKAFVRKDPINKVFDIAPYLLAEFKNKDVDALDQDRNFVNRVDKMAKHGNVLDEFKVMIEDMTDKVEDKVERVFDFKALLNKLKEPRLVPFPVNNKQDKECLSNACKAKLKEDVTKEKVEIAANKLLVAENTFNQAINQLAELQLGPSPLPKSTSTLKK